MSTYPWFSVCTGLQNLLHLVLISYVQEFKTILSHRYADNYYSLPVSDIAVVQVITSDKN